ncbi:hypothetical protein BDZ94DRAFT_1313563 [Collybia nuda]|uniref:Uncharacterized protein n=1 Tax=Collybia nuda TaxID=64659 RepID=A0A9P5XWZ7_9AGAR|nr:hypothetical protein BDZ94DRAFT_1313563 [Collybia nuda]
MLRPSSQVLVFAASYFVASVTADTWCGKNYMPNLPVVPPGGEFPIASTGNMALLALRCAPTIRPYLPEDSSTTDSSVSILVDAHLTFRQIANASPISRSGDNEKLNVTVFVDGKRLTSGEIMLGSTKNTLPFSLSALSPRTSPYTISCSTTFDGKTFTATGSLSYLPTPPPTIGSVTKMDLRTGALLARPADGKGGAYAPVLPIGFYTSFDSYLATDLSISATLKRQGFTIVHPVPAFNNITALDAVLDKMQEAGLYLMYDMRGTYMNKTSVTEQVNHIKSRPNLLLWYTADEPDGTTDPFDATLVSSNLITSLDGGDGVGGAGYHPVSLVLNCEDYHFTEYTSGSDIVLQDTYMIGNNVTFSSQWGTVCTRDYGDCGCDNCEGKFEDISTRMDEFKDRLLTNGWDRTKAVWTVPQGFGNETYWKRYPTGKEFVVESILGINHGGLGVVSWDDPTPADIKASASLLALSLPQMTPFILNPAAIFRQVTIRRVDLGLWTVGTKTLVLASNMNYATVSVHLSELGLPKASIASQALDSGATTLPDKAGFTFESVGSGAWILRK